MTLTRSVLRMSLFIVSILAGLVPAEANAIVYTNGPIFPNAASMSDISQQVFIADQFRLQRTIRTDEIRFWGSYFPGNMPAADDFTLRLFANTPDSAVPGSLLLTFELDALVRTDTGQMSAQGFQRFLYEASFPRTKLQKGVYWLSIANNTLSSPDDWIWIYATGDVHTDLIAVHSLNAWHRQSGGNLSFDLLRTRSSVPEPGPLALLMLSVTAIAFRRRS
jgi:hypothetical protein